MKKTLLLGVSSLCFSFFVSAQKDSVSSLSDLSIEKLMNIPIYSVSKLNEPTFDAPLSSTVLTREQIVRAGCTSIPEALRLVPGVIVREQTNGNYDVHIRGLDNIPPNSALVFLANSTTLVMIDNRPVYDYLRGGTFWETLPVSIGNIERIEVVRGPSAPLYGPNAVSGVINIITRKIKDIGLYYHSKVQYGSYNSLIANVTYGYKWNDKIDANFSVGYQHRNRTQTSYYDLVTNKYVDPIDSVTLVRQNPAPSNIRDRYPDPSLALDRYMLNGFLNYNPKPGVQFSLIVGGQKSAVQKEIATDPWNFAADLTTATSETRYADLKGTINNLTFQLSDMGGVQAPLSGVNSLQWNFNTFDGVVEYNYSKIKNLTIRPSFNFREATYDDSKYIVMSLHNGLFSGKVQSVTTAASLRLDYKLFKEKLRLTGAGRVDWFNYPTTPYFSYQLTGTYKINENNLVRVVQARSNRTPLLIDLFSDLNVVSPGTFVQLRGNTNIKLLTSDMTEVGFRSNVNNMAEVDVEVFHTITKNFSDLVLESASFGPNGFTASYDINNLTVSAEEFGTTLSINFLAKKWEFRPFMTVQATTLRDYSPYNNTANVPALPSNPDPIHNNLNSGLGTRINHKGTPTAYGGAYINWKPTKRLNINFNPYYWTEQTQYASANVSYMDGQRGVQVINAKLLWNMCFAYTVEKRLTFSCSIRNLLNDTSKEFYKADSPTLMVYGGASFRL